MDEYCRLYGDLFPEVRSVEAFKFLHLGTIIDPTPILSRQLDLWLGFPRRDRYNFAR